MALRVVHPGQFSTVQDLGRRGFAHLGVPRGGAADTLSLRVGNRLIGNPDHAPGVEMTLVGGEFEATEDLVVAVTGTAERVVVRAPGGAERAAPAWAAVSLRVGERVRVGAIAHGARAYLCVRAGLDLPPVLAARGSLFDAGVPGIQGRTLRRGDDLRVGVPAGSPRRALEPGEIERLRSWLMRAAFRTVPGPADDAGRLFDAEFVVSSHWDRRGLRLLGPPAPATATGHSEGVEFGCIERTPDGAPILLGPDSPPTGGYPVVGCVAAVDLPCVGQLLAGRRVRFERITVEQAWEALRRRERELNDMIPPPTSGVTTIDLSADVGEDPDALERDAAIARHVSSLNIACAGHAGDERTMREMVRLGLAHGCAIGAHPSYPDRTNFGRVEMNIAPDALEASLREQLGTLRRVAESFGARIAHVKPHGALYHAAMRRREVAEAVARAVEAICPAPALVGAAGEPGLSWWRERGFGVLPEVLADRRYASDGRPVPRSRPDALLTPQEAADQALSVAQGRGVPVRAGEYIRLDARTLGIHSDTPHATEVARAVRESLERANIQVRATGA